MGRPTAEPKNNGYRIRLTDTELNMLEFCCKETGKNKADVLRLGIEMVYAELDEKDTKK